VWDLGDVSDCRIVDKLIKPITEGADKSLARPGSKQATAIEGFEFHLSYL